MLEECGPEGGYRTPFVETKYGEASHRDKSIFLGRMDRATHTLELERNSIVVPMPTQQQAN